MKSQVKIRPTTKNCLIAITEFPFFVLDINEIEAVHFERVQFGIKNFDMAIIYRDFITHKRINTNPRESIDEVKGELLRLREDTDKTAPTPGGAASSSRASLPALVPGLPAGILVTPEMEDLLSKLLSSASPRVGFCGM